MLEYENKKEGENMTEFELQKARDEYKKQIEGKRLLLEALKNESISSFTKHYFANVKDSNIQSFTNDEILRNVFLSTFRDTKESKNLYIYINRIKRKNVFISDGQPILESISWENAGKERFGDLELYSFYCDLETNKPLLVGKNEIDAFINRTPYLELPDYTPKTETYHYNSSNLEQITKGFATEKFNRLQLYFFKELLENSYDRAVARILNLTNQQKNAICSGK